MKNIFKNISKIKYILPLLVLVVCVAFAVNSFTNGSFSADSVNKRETINIENSTTNSTTTSSTGSNDITTSPLPSESGNNNSTSNSEKVKSVLPLTLNSNQKYKDGTYYGTGVGFNGNLTVKVIIKNGKITNIDIVNTGDGDEYIAKAKGLLKSIYAKQNTNVDTVSGATYSSNGLIEAVSNALSKAVVNKDNSKSYANNNKNTNNIATTTTPRKSPTKPSVPNMNNATFKDGTYIGVGEGYKGDIKVSVVIKNGKIYKINILSTEDDEQYFSKARKLTSSIITKQTADVDTVSGATFSSNGIIEAVSNALQKAYVKQTTTVPTTTITTTTNNSTSTTLPSNPTVKLKYENGTYMAQVVCYPIDSFDFEEYTLSLKISIFDDVITSIDDVIGVGDNYDTANDWYLNRAVRGTTKYPSVVKQILNKNSTDVDTVSGATCSSKAIIEAVNKALLIAEVKGD